MYIGDPQSVAAIMLFWRYRAKPKSAAGGEGGVKKDKRREEVPQRKTNPAPVPLVQT